ncbi:MAG: hypothetical protein HY974_02015 [Candidatus Kerfeldbacteria bacterium]|nr:hypothetical protein [Candidatus Kerfeldbacteria bacterium]
MWGVILASLGTLFDEISLSIGKFEVSSKRESTYTMAFLNLVFSTAIFVVLALTTKAFSFSLASLPTFSLRVVLEIIQIYVTMLAIVTADRSTFSFIRVLTIPLLLGMDGLLGYTFEPLQVVGLILIVAVIALLSLNHGLGQAGRWLVGFTAVNAVLTISLYKYDITHFNSVVGEQLTLQLILMVCLFLAARFWTNQNPLILLRQSIFFTQSAAQGIGSVVESFAYSFAPASIVLAAKRSSAVLWSIVSGSQYFHERHVVLKLTALGLLTVGIVLLII